MPLEFLLESPFHSTMPLQIWTKDREGTVTILAVISSKNSLKSMVPEPSLSMSEIIFLISSFFGSNPSALIATLSSFASIVPWNGNQNYLDQTNGFNFRQDTLFEQVFNWKFVATFHVKLILCTNVFVRFECVTNCAIGALQLRRKHNIMQYELQEYLQW